MSSVPMQNFSVPAGTDQDITVTVLSTEEGDTLEGSLVYWRAYEQVYGMVTAGVDPVIEKSSETGGGIDIPSTPLMTFVLSLTAEDTVSLLRNYYYEVTVVGEIGEHDTVLTGIMTVNQTENRIE